MALQMHISYRDSKLTRVLKDSLTNPETYILMLVTVNPDPSFFDDTFNTLSFCNKIKQIKVEQKHRLNMFKALPRAPSTELHSMEEANNRLHQIERGLFIKVKRAQLPKAPVRNLTPNNKPPQEPQLLFPPLKKPPKLPSFHSHVKSTSVLPMTSEFIQAPFYEQ